MQLGAADFATMNNAELIALGVDAHLVTAERERLSGHVRRIAKRYAASIGMWGGVEPLVAIAERLDLDINTVRNFAKSRRLRWATRRRRLTPAQLAVKCMAVPGAARDVARVLGVLPIEVVLARSAVTELVVEHCVSFADLIEWKPEQLEREWTALHLRVEGPRVRIQHVSDPGYLRSIVAEAERLVAAGEVEDD